MTRLQTTVWILLVAVSPSQAVDKFPATQPPRLVLAKVNDDQLTITERRNRYITETRTRQIPISKIVNGKPVTAYISQQYTVSRPVFEAVTRSYPGGTWTIETAKGVTLFPDEAAEELKENRFALVSTDGKPIAAEYRKLYGDKVLFLDVPTLTEVPIAPAPILRPSAKPPGTRSPPANATKPASK